MSRWATHDHDVRGARHTLRLACRLLRASLLLLAASCAAPSQTAGDSRHGNARLENAPNVVVVLLDDLEVDAFEFMPLTRALVADSGARFDSAFVTAPLCCPSRVSLLRGQYAHNTGVLANGGRNGGFAAAHRLGVERSTLGTWLQDAGYRTALFGKYLNYYPDGAAETYVPPGWTRWAVRVLGTPYSGFDYVLNVDGALRSHGSDDKDYITDVLRDLAVDFIAEASQADVPFFVLVSTFAPHSPSIPAPRHRGLFASASAPVTPATHRSDLSRKPSFMRDLPSSPPPFLQAQLDSLYRLRLQSLQAVDEAVAQLIETLRDRGELQRTLFMVTSDNGYHFGIHGLPAGKETAYEGDIRVPLVARGMGVVAGQRIGELVLNTDLAPTIMDVTGVSSRVPMDGRSLVPLLRGDRTLAWRRAFLLSRDLPEHLRARGARTGAASSGGVAPPSDLAGNAPDSRRSDPGARTRRAPLAAAVAALTPQQRRAFQRVSSFPSFRGVRTNDGWSYVRHEGDEEELYDLTRDPHQLRNLASDAAEDARLLGQLVHLRAWTDLLSRCSGEECRTLEERGPDGGVPTVAAPPTRGGAPR